MGSVRKTLDTKCAVIQKRLTITEKTKILNKSNQRTLLFVELAFFDLSPNYLLKEGHPPMPLKIFIKSIQ